MSKGSRESSRLVKYMGTGLGIATVLFVVTSLVATKIVYDKQFPRYDSGQRIRGEYRHRYDNGTG